MMCIETLLLSNLGDIHVVGQPRKQAIMWFRAWLLADLNELYHLQHGVFPKTSGFY